MVPAHLNNETASLLKARRLPSCLVLQLTYKSQASFAKHFNSPDHCNYWMGSSAALWLVHASRLDRRGVGKGFKIKWIMAHLLFFSKGHYFALYWFSFIPAAHRNAKQAPAMVGMWQVIFGQGDVRLLNAICVTSPNVTWSQDSL